MRTKNFLNREVPNYSDLKRDYKVLDTEALKIQLDIFGSDEFSFFAAAHRMLLKAFDDEKISKGDSKRIPAFKYVGKAELGDVVIPEGVEEISINMIGHARCRLVCLPN